MGLGPSRFVFWGAGGGELQVSVGPQPWLLPRSTRFTSPLHSGLFSITQGSPVTGWNSKPKPNMWRWAPDRAKPAETSEPVPRRCHDNGAHQRGDRRTERGRDGRSHGPSHCDPYSPPPAERDSRPMFLGVCRLFGGDVGGGDPAINDQRSASHEGGLVRGEEQRGVGDLLRPPEPTN